MSTKPTPTWLRTTAEASEQMAVALRAAANAMRDVLIEAQGTTVATDDILARARDFDREASELAASAAEHRAQLKASR